MAPLKFKYTILAIAVFAVLSNSFVKCEGEDEEEDDEDEYEEEAAADIEVTTDSDSATKKYRLRTTTDKSKVTTLVPPPSGRNGSVSDSDSSAGTAPAATAAPIRVAAPAPVAAAVARPPLPPAAAPVRATTPSESQEDESTEDPGGRYGFVFRPLSNLINNVAAGNVTGIVDHALAIRTPPEVRLFVNSVMSNIFGSSVGTGLRTFLPKLFTTTPVSTDRDPIPGQQVPSRVVVTTGQIARVPIRVSEPIPVESSIVEARAKTEEVSGKKGKPVPIQLKFAHPGAPASRLKCEIVAD